MVIRRVAGKLEQAFSWWREVQINWRGFEKADVVIMYSANSDYLVPLCGKAKTLVVDVESRKMQLNLGALITLTRLVFKGATPKNAYFAAVLREISPAIVITFIDNSELFHRVSSLNQKLMRFLAIQNGARYDVVEMAHKQSSKIFIPEFACFGEYERELYTSSNAKIGKFIPIGSLRESYFRKYWKDAAPNSAAQYDHDICVVAEASPGWNKIYPGSEDAIGNIAKYAVRLAKETGLKLVIAGKRDVAPEQLRANIHQRDVEVAWYEKYIGADISITPRIRNQFTTYGLMARSRISLALMSTTLREAASRGNRVIFCNFSNDRRWDFCLDGIWSLTSNSYEAFAERVTTVLAMSNEEWTTRAEKMAQYVMNNDDKHPTHIALAEIIAAAVNARLESKLAWAK